jgi:Flp pilus assembly protein TadG
MNRREERGQAVVEFTLIATVLATLLLACFQFGVAYSDYISVTDAARAAAREASSYGAPATYDAATATQAQAMAIEASQGSSGHFKTGSACSNDNWCTTLTAVDGPTSWMAGHGVAATVTAPYTISILGFSVVSGTLTHTVTMQIGSRAA